MRSRHLTVLIALAVALVLAAPALASAANQITWDKKGHLTRLGPFKKLAKRDITLGDFRKKFGAPQKKFSLNGGSLCRATWTSSRGFAVNFGRAARSKHACVNSSIFTSISISGPKMNGWTVGGQVIAYCTTLDEFKLRYPQTTLNYEYPKGVDHPDEQAWTISPTYKYIDPYFHTQTKPNPISDVVGRFYRVIEGSEHARNCPLAPLDSFVLEGYLVVKKADWLN